MHIEFLVEEPSCAEALTYLVPKIIGAKATWILHAFQGKQDLLQNLPVRLKGYAKWLPEDYRIVVLVDCDADDCKKLKYKLEKIAADNGLITKTAAFGKQKFQVLNRIAIEELEAWFFGDMNALAAAYPGVSSTLGNKRSYRDPDGIAGGTWEALERVLKKAGYYQTGMAKIEVARSVAPRMEPDQNRSHCFGVFRDGLRAIVG